MSERDINIDIKTTADTSGAKAAEKSLQNLGTEERRLTQIKAQFMTAQEAEVAETNRLIESSNRARKAREAATAQINPAVRKTEELTEATRRYNAATASSSRSAGRFNGRLQQVGYQVADFAVQVEAGTSKLRAFSQQGSQVLGAFGPWGAIAGAVLAVGAAIFSARQNMGDAAEGAEELETAMDALKEAMEEADKAFKLEGLKESNRTFADRIESVDELSDSLERQLEVEKKLMDIAFEKEDAIAAAEIRKIDANDDLTDEQKFDQTAAIRERVAENARQKKLANIGLAETKARLAVQEEQKKLEAARAAVAETSAGGTDAANDLAGAANAVVRREGANNEIDTTAEEIGNVQAQKRKLLDGAITSVREGTRRPLTEDEQAKFKGLEKQIAELEKRQSAAKAILKETTEEAAKNEYEKAVEIYEAAQDELTKAQEALDDQKKAAAVAAEVESGTKQIAAAERDLVETERVASKSDFAIGRATFEKEAEEERKKESEKEAEKKSDEEERVRNAERDLETDITGIGKDAADATEGLGARGINPEGFNELASRIARKGDAQGDRINLASFLEKVSMLVDAIPDSQSSGEDADKLRQVERKLEKKIDDLTSRLNREGDR